MLKVILCIDQTCMFKSGTWDIPDYDGHQQNIYYCTILNAKLIHENETITTAITRKFKSNDDVQAIQYYQGILKYIPSSLFTEFLNMEILFIGEDQHLEDLKSYYFRNANLLKVIWISGNDVITLEKNLFIDAINLQYINLQSNKITNIHKLAFNGLQKVKQISLNGNQIKILHPETFNNLSRLQNLNLLSLKNCINESFDRAFSQKSLIHDEIRKLCSYVLFADEVNEIEVKNKEERNVIEKIKNQEEMITKFAEKIAKSDETNKNLIAKNVILEGNMMKLQEAFDVKFEEFSAKFQKGFSCSEEFPKISQHTKNNSESIYKLSEQFEKKSLVNFSVLVKLIQDQKLVIESMNDEAIKTNKNELSMIANKLEVLEREYEFRLEKIEKSVELLKVKT